MSTIAYFLAMEDSRIHNLRNEPGNVADYLMEAQETPVEGSEVLDVDKAWGGIHFMLAGKQWEGEPKLNFILAGDSIGEEDVGYGPARGFRSDEVQAIARALAGISREKLHEKFDAEKMTAANIYPDIWDEGQEAFDYCALHFEALQKYVAEAARNGLGMVVWMA